MNCLLYLIRKRALLEAINDIAPNLTKGGPILYGLLRQAAHVSQRKGMNTSFMYINEAYVGKKLGQKKLDIRARGKMGMMQSSISSVTIKCIEKPYEEVLKQNLLGNAERNLAA